MGRRRRDPYGREQRQDCGRSPNMLRCAGARASMIHPASPLSAFRLRSIVQTLAQESTLSRETVPGVALSGSVRPEVRIRIPADQRPPDGSRPPHRGPCAARTHAARSRRLSTGINASTRARLRDLSRFTASVVGVCPALWGVARARGLPQEERLSARAYAQFSAPAGWQSIPRVPSTSPTPPTSGRRNGCGVHEAGQPPASVAKGHSDCPISYPPSMTAVATGTGKWRLTRSDSVKRRPSGPICVKRQPHFRELPATKCESVNPSAMSPAPRPGQAPGPRPSPRNPEPGPGWGREDGIWLWERLHAPHWARAGALPDPRERARGGTETPVATLMPSGRAPAPGAR
jgi:hypothetical protein